MERLADGLYVTEKVDSEGLTIDFFLEHVEEAKELGLTHWATQTDKESVGPWLTRIVFYIKDENTYERRR